MVMPYRRSSASELDGEFVLRTVRDLRLGLQVLRGEKGQLD